MLNRAGGEPIAILNHNKPTAYIIPAIVYERMLEVIENAELLEIAKDRLSEKENAVQVKLDDL